ncbi:hypothetical protein NLX86_27215 [Streptomyces sp. A3M-1-3]|uniref:DUF7405 family protein n=1 Tax=Streptomyces sp. A3M-1-3 TaxID=2962044 RepID=UPI0020B6538A|nr:hypothetical protein [Streptomyces sp. A3M-1-3]MCP3821649.1 hypothetical protein [Streptomyces sp. A3M-1-3]
MTELPAAQHAWESTFRTDEDGRPLAPRFHRLLMLDVAGDPAAADVKHLEYALRALEEQLPYGPGGLLTCLGWGPGWFENHTPARSPVARPVPMARWENPRLESFDACLHLASDDEHTLAEVTGQLFGDGPLDQRERLRLTETRTGFVGRGLPAERRPGAAIPDRAPLMLGFHSGLRGNQAPEDRVTVAAGPLAGGTTMHVSYIELDVDSWYEQDPDTRSAQMFSPRVTADEAEKLVDDAKSDADSLPALAAVHGRVGHAQATGRARLHGVPRINRRDFATLDHGSPGTHFVSLQRTMEDFNATRAVMNAGDATGHHARIGVRRRNGINSFMDVRSRATFAVPARRDRAYPLLGH